MKRLLFVVLSLFVIQIAGACHSCNYRIKNITHKDGLTNSKIQAICQDKYGFIWIATEGGLFKYDGFRMKTYMYSLNDSTSINSNVVYSLLNDSHGNLWAGTYRGIMLYDRDKDSFIDLKVSEKFSSDNAFAIKMISEVPGLGILAAGKYGVLVVDTLEYKIDKLKTETVGEAISNQTDITAFLYGSDDQLWIGSLGGLYLWDLELTVSEYIDLSSVSGVAESNYVMDILEDKEGDIWISTRGGGVFRRKKQSGEILSYRHSADHSLSLGSNECYDIWEESENKIWFATQGDGICVFDKDKESFSRLNIKSRGKGNVLNNNTRIIFADKQDNLWIGLQKDGLNILITESNQFNYQSFAINDEVSFNPVGVNSIYLETEDILWAGTDGEGLKRFDRKTGSLLTFHPLAEKEHVFPGKVVMDIHPLESGKLWMGTYLEGLVEFDPATYTYRQYKHDPENPNSISSHFVSVIYEDRNKNLWVGTNGGGLNLYNREKDSFVVYRHDSEHPGSSISSDDINTIVEDSSGNLWIGTFWGISRFDTKRKVFSNYTVEEGFKNGLINNIIYTIHLDKKNRLWIGTQIGLLQYDYESDHFENYTEIEGISNNKISSILEDGDGNLWIATDKGLFKFNPDNNSVNKYSVEDGLQGNEFFRNASHKGFNGELFFGGYKGLTYFFADSIEESLFEPEVVISKLKVLNKEIPIGELEDGRVILEKNISETDKIRLRFSDKSFSLEFSAVDFTESSKNIYAYRLDNFDEDWNTSDVKYPFATYTNLSPGEYVFRIKAGKKEQIDKIKHEKTIHITITPPFWRTWFAYLAYALIISSVIFYFWRLSIQRLKEKNAAKIEKVKREQTEKISQARLQFFMNISHEIRTPLTLIIGPLEQLLEKRDEGQSIRSHLDIMLKNARRLLRLINQLLDLRKIELDKMKLNAEYADLTKFVKDIVFTFQEYAADKKIDLKFHSEQGSIMVWFDPDKMDKIVFNLLSNAIKYTDERGTVSVYLKNNTRLTDEYYNYVELMVSDTGKGIRQNELKHIFERFYQGSSKGEMQQGSGLGLSLTHSFVAMHKGIIDLESVENVGSKFKLLFPNSDVHLGENDKSDQATEPGLNQYLHISSENYMDKSPGKMPGKMTGSQPKQARVLIVEDNVDMRDYLKSELQSEFTCYEAAEGNSGIEMAVDLMPDLIISDIMMPGMNGLELCTAIKENIITSHIPVVLLTAKSQVENQVEGYKVGADAYIQKPFVLASLKSNIYSILENRLRLREKYSSPVQWSKRQETGSIDDRFIKRLDNIINEYLSDSQLSVEMLAGEMGLSRVHLHRKMKAILNISPNEYIRKIRIQRAAELLLQGDMRISEVSREVGFNSTSHFSSSFKKHFGISPRAFVEQKRI